MKIALVHSFYRAGPSGENSLVSSACLALSELGHDVVLFSKRTDDEISNWTSLVRAGVRVATGVGQSPLKEIEAFSPDIVHVHNLFPNWSEHWVRLLSAPSVVTVHNFRKICAAGTLMREGKECLLCPTSGSFHSVSNKCYRGSSVATLPLAASTRRNQSKKFFESFDKIIFLSELVRKTFAPFLGSDLIEKSVIIPNFVDCPEGRVSAKSSLEARDYWVFSGRLSEEKGILRLIEHWPKSETLKIFGDGPLLDKVRQLSRNRRICVMGSVPRVELLHELRSSRGLIFPSIWREGGVPLAYLDALCVGIPVVAKSGNFVAEDISLNSCGTIFPEFQDLHLALAEAKNKSEHFSMNSAKLFRAAYSKDAWLHGTLGLYNSLIHQRT